MDCTKYQVLPLHLYFPGVFSQYVPSLQSSLSSVHSLISLEKEKQIRIDSERLDSVYIYWKHKEGDIGEKKWKRRGEM